MTSFASISSVASMALSLDYYSSAVFICYLRKAMMSLAVRYPLHNLSNLWNEAYGSNDSTLHKFCLANSNYCSLAPVRVRSFCSFFLVVIDILFPPCILLLWLFDDFGGDIENNPVVGIDTVKLILSLIIYLSLNRLTLLKYVFMCDDHSIFIASRF